MHETRVAKASINEYGRPLAPEGSTLHPVIQVYSLFAKVAMYHVADPVSSSQRWSVR